MCYRILMVPFLMAALLCVILFTCCAVCGVLVGLPLFLLVTGAIVTGLRRWRTSLTIP